MKKTRRASSCASRTRILVVGADSNTSCTIICMRAEYGVRGAVFAGPLEVQTPEDIPEDVRMIWISGTLDEEEQQRLVTLAKKRGITGQHVVFQTAISSLRSFLNQQLPANGRYADPHIGWLSRTKPPEHIPAQPETVSLEEFITRRLELYDWGPWLEPEMVLHVAWQIGIRDADLRSVKKILSALKRKFVAEQTDSTTQLEADQEVNQLQKPKPAVLKDFVAKREKTDQTVGEQAGWIYQEAVKAGIKTTPGSVRQTLWRLRMERREQGLALTSVPACTAADRKPKPHQRSRFSREEIELILKGFGSA